MHGVLVCFHILDQIGVLAGWHEDWEDEEVGAAFIVLLLVEHVSIDQEWFPILQILLNHSLPVVQDSCVPLRDDLVIVLLLIVAKILISTNIGRGHHMHEISLLARIRRTRWVKVAFTFIVNLLFHFAEDGVKTVMHVLILSPVLFGQKQDKIVKSHHLLALPVGEVAIDDRWLHGISCFPLLVLPTLASFPLVLRRRLLVRRFTFEPSNVAVILLGPTTFAVVVIGIEVKTELGVSFSIFRVELINLLNHLVEHLGVCGLASFVTDFLIIPEHERVDPLIAVPALVFFISEQAPLPAAWHLLFHAKHTV